MLGILNRFRSLGVVVTAVGLGACGNLGGNNSRSDDTLGSTVTTFFQNGVAPSSAYEGTYDTFLEEATPGTNYGTAGTLVADRDYPDGTGKNADAILRFDLSSIPPGSKVFAATLTLNVTNATGGSYELYAIKRSWEDSTATWASALSGEGWQTAGARGADDRASTALGTVAPRVKGKTVVTLNAAGLALVQQWVDTPSVPTGIAIDSATNTDGLGFDSSEAITADTRPKLSVTYAQDTSPPPGAGTGLLGEYFSGMAFETSVLSRTDATVNFNWASGTPASGIGADNFSVRWSGQVQPLFSQTYTFFVRSDDGARLWVNGQQIINNWTDHAATENSGTITLTAGQKYAVKLEFYEKGGQAVSQLSWSSPGQAKQIIPATQLYPAVVTNPPPAGATPINTTGSGRRRGADQY